MQLKKWGLSLLAVTMLGAIIGCGGGAPADTAGQTGDGAATDAGAEAGDGTITISTIMPVAPETKFREGETIENNVFTKWAKEKFGIEFKFLWTVTGASDVYDNKLQLMLSSNEPLPDVFRVSKKEQISELIASGRVMDLTDAIEQYASPRLKEMYAQFPGVTYPSTFEGRQYGIPVVSGGNVSDPVMWIRQDWLDKLGLQAPTTVEEFENVMDAFVNQDPDGNGQKDTIGMSLAMKNSIVNWMADGSFLIGSFGGKAGDRQWGFDENGGLEYGGIQPEMKQALGKLNEWYAKGYLDKEVAILDENKAVESFLNGKSGIVFGAGWMTDWPFTDMLSLHPEAKLKPYPVPAGADGSIGRRGEPVYFSTIMINKDFQHIEKFFEYLNTAYGWYYGEGDFKYGFAEGYDYVLVDGKPVYDDDKIPGGRVEPLKYFVGTYHQVDIPFLQYQVYRKIYEGGKPETTVEERWAATNPLWLEAGTIVDRQNEYRMEDKFEGPATPGMQAHKEYLEKIEKEAYAQIVYGQQPLDYFDKFVEDWKKNGGDQITTEVNEWYASVQGQ